MEFSSRLISRHFMFLLSTSQEKIFVLFGGISRGWILPIFPGKPFWAPTMIRLFRGGSEHFS
jgi:hypothetical protein